MESKLRKLLAYFEKLSEILGHEFELRPWPKAYKFDLEEFPSNNIHYFGIRIRKGVRQLKEKVDITETLKKFYDKLN